MHKFLNNFFLQLPMYLHITSSCFWVDFVVETHSSLLCMFLFLKKKKILIYYYWYINYIIKILKGDLFIQKWNISYLDPNNLNI